MLDKVWNQYLSKTRDQLRDQAIEHFASLGSRDLISKSGSIDPVESRYMPQKLPERQDVEDFIQRMLNEDHSVSFDELQNELDLTIPPCVHESTIRDALDMMGLNLDPTTDRFVPFSAAPTLEEIATVLGDQGS